MKVILLERVGKHGHIGDEVTVKDGYARNFLLPQHKALRATEANRKRFEAERASIEKRNAERREAAAGIAAGLNGQTVVIIRQAGETGQLYGSVSSRDVAEALSAAGFSVARSQVDLDRIIEIERTTDHDAIAFVSQVAESVGPEGRYLHLGLTSSDVVDTGLALQLRAAGGRLLTDADRLIGALVARARAEADTVMMGRTHSVHAEPTTMGLKLAGWAFEIDRGRRRLAG